MDDDADDNADDNANNDADKQLDNEVGNYNWNNKILDILESLKLDIKNKKTNSEVWMHLNSIHLYLQLVKYNHPKMKASEIVANVAGKEIYYAKCICS